MKKYLYSGHFWASIVLGLVIVGTMMVSAESLAALSGIFFPMFSAQYSDAHLIWQTIVVGVLFVVVSTVLMVLPSPILKISLSWRLLARFVIIAILSILFYSLPLFADILFGIMTPGHPWRSDIVTYGLFALVPLAMMFGVVRYATILTDSTTNTNN